MILPELREWPLGRGSKVSVGLGTDALERLLSGCEMGVPEGGGNPWGKGVLECLRARGNLGHDILEHVGPWLLTEKLGVNNWKNGKAGESTGPMKT